MSPSNLSVNRTRLSRRGLLIAGLGGAAAVGLAACGGDDPDDAADDNASTDAGSDNVTELTFTSWSMNEDTVKEQLGQLLTDWSAETGVSVDTPSYPYNDYLAQVLLQISGGQATGVAQTDIAWLGTLAATGQLVDLGGSATAADYTEAALAATQVGDVQYGLPWTNAAIGMLYNALLLEEAGVEAAPETIEEFEAALEALQGLGVTPYAAMTDLAQLKDIIPWMWQFGSPVYDGTELTLGDEGSVAAVAWYKDLLDRGLIAADMDRFDARALYAQGTVGFYEDAIGAPNAIASSANDESIVEAMTPTPRPVANAGDEPTALAWGHAIVVFDGDEQRAGIDLAEHLTGDPDVAIEYFTASNVVPTTQTALSSSEVTGNEWASEFTELITVGARANPFWVFPQYGQIEEALGNHVQRVLLGEASPQDAMNDAKSEIEQLMN